MAHDCAVWVLLLVLTQPSSILKVSVPAMDPIKRWEPLPHDPLVFRFVCSYLRVDIPSSSFPPHTVMSIFLEQELSPFS
eukprot:SAG11_NODE_4052_length_2085_cov_7.690836_1_plen_79_part_00